MSKTSNGLTYVTRLKLLAAVHFAAQPIQLSVSTLFQRVLRNIKSLLNCLHSRYEKNQVVRLIYVLLS